MKPSRKRAVSTLGVSTAVALGAIAASVGAAGASTSRTSSLPAAVALTRDEGSGSLGALGTVGTITAMAAGSLTVTDAQGTTATYAIAATTLVRRDGHGTTPDQLRVGQTVAVLVAQAGATTATTIVVVPAAAVADLGAVGTITAVAPGTLTVTDAAGAATSYVLTAQTRVMVGPAAIPATSLSVGQGVRVDVAPSGSTTATVVQLEPAHVEGVITAVSGDQITVRDRHGFDRTVIVGPSTSYRGVASSATAGSLGIGATIIATGIAGADHSSLEAIVVELDHASGHAWTPGARHDSGRRAEGAGSGAGGRGTP